MRSTFATIPMTLLACTLGCSAAPPKPSLMADMAKSEWTTAQLRAVDYEFAARFGQLVAACVTEIVSQTDNAENQDRAYQWRMWASPQARAAAFDHDPFAGLIELWVLAEQQHIYFTEGSGRGYFGDEASCVSQTTARLEREARQLVSEVVSPERLKGLTNSVDAWVAEHRIEGEMFVRPTARADIASLVPAKSHGGLKAVGSIEDSITDLNSRIAILTVQMPAEIRWQAEYLIHALFEERVNDPIEAVIGAADQVTAFLVEFEATVAAQTEVVMERIQFERIAVFDAIEAERETVLAAVEEQRIAVMQDVDDQVAAATVGLDKVGRGLIDHFFVRLVEVLVVLGLVGFLTVLLVLFVVRRRDRSND